MARTVRFGSLWGVSIGEFRRHARILIPVALLFGFVPSAIMLVGYAATERALPAAISPGDLGMTFVSALFSILLTVSVLEFLRKRRGVRETLVAGGKRFFDGLALSVVTLLALLGLLLLLIVPAIIFAIRWTFAYYAMIDGKGIRDSLRASSALVKGRWWQVFGKSLLLGLVVVAVVFAAAILIGMLVAIIGMVAGAGPAFATSVPAAVLVQSALAAVSALVTVFALIFFKEYYLVLKKTRV